MKVGWYDTYPGGSGNGFEGCWGVYPYFPSGNIVASNIRNPNTNDGVLYVLTPTYVRGCYLEGQVTSAATGQPLPGAKVTIIGTSTQESANANGDYKMGQVENGVFTVQVSLPGYITHTGQVTLDNGVLTIHNVALSQQPLPVELVRFDVKAAGQNAILNWETATETGNAGFEIQQTIAGKQEWQPIAMVPPKGDGKSPARYDFRTETLQPGKYIFRLRQIDLDGGSTLLPARTVTIYGSSLQISLSPNPAGAETRIIIGTAQREKVALKLLDAQGRPTGFSSETEVDGALEIPLPLDDLPAGQYLLMGQTGRESVRKILIKN
ncbi:MAG: carboxypeptidase-like regulatory domain-containing protein [Thermoanaerobaculia bacterium]|nr:carboxypeptidase-like regulatory domain-containing protein [Thermoanaerobaculia bacterium]